MGQFDFLIEQGEMRTSAGAGLLTQKTIQRAKKPSTLIAIAFAMLTYIGPVKADQMDQCFDCLFQAELDDEKYNKCMQAYFDYCFAQGENFFDYPPQEFCFASITNAVKLRIANIFENAEKAPATAMIWKEARAFTRIPQSIDKQCDSMFQRFHLSPHYLNPDLPSDTGEIIFDACQASSYVRAYWRIHVNGEIN